MKFLKNLLTLKSVPWVIAGLCGPSIARTLWSLLHLQAVLDCLSPAGYRAVRGIETSEIDNAVAAHWLIWGILLIGANWFLRYCLERWVAARNLGKSMWKHVTAPWFQAPVVWTVIWFALLPFIWWLLGYLCGFLPDAIYVPGRHVYRVIASVVGPAYDAFWEWLKPACLRAILVIVPWGSHFVDETTRFATHH